MFHARTKHIDVRYHFIREALEDGLIALIKVNTSQNPVDALTNCLPNAHQLCIQLVGVLSLKEPLLGPLSGRLVGIKATRTHVLICFDPFL